MGLGKSLGKVARKITGSKKVGRFISKAADPISAIRHSHHRNELGFTTGPFGLASQAQRLASRAMKAYTKAVARIATKQATVDTSTSSASVNKANIDYRLDTRYRRLKDIM